MGKKITGKRVVALILLGEPARNWDERWFKVVFEVRGFWGLVRSGGKR